ncbi:MAG: glycosyltransferase 87 family protein, partial [Promethearchaeota archaeon]
MELKSRFRSFITPKLVFIVSLIIFSVFIMSLYNGMLNPFFSATTNVYGQGADFFSFYQAGYNVLHDKLYYNFTKEDMVVPYLYSYRYSAFFAYTFGVIFNLAPPFISYRGWVVFIIIFLLFTSFYTLKITKKLRCGDSTRYISASMWLVFTPIYADLYLGQVSLFVSLLVFWSLYLETKKNLKSETLGNLLYAIASIIKYIPYLMILAYLKHKRTAKAIFSLIFTLFFIALWDLPHIMTILKFNFMLSTGGVGSEGSFDFRNLIYRFLHFMATNIFNLDGEEFITQFNNNIIYINALFIIGGGIITLYGIIYSQNYLVSLSLSVMAYFIMFSKIWEH